MGIYAYLFYQIYIIKTFFYNFQNTFIHNILILVKFYS